MTFTYTQVNGKKLKQNIKYDQQTNPRLTIAKYDHADNILRESVQIEF